MGKYWRCRLSDDMPFDEAMKRMELLRYYYITRKDYDGFLFKNYLGELCILLKSGEVLVNPQKVFNTDKKDWFNVTITKETLIQITNQTNLDDLESFEYEDLFISFNPKEVDKDKVISYVDGIDKTCDCIGVYVDEDGSLDWY